MPSKREQAISPLFGQLQAIPGAVVKRNEALPSSVPAGGLVILRDGDPGEPDVTLNPAVTRGKRFVVIVGQKKAMAIAVKGKQTGRKWSKLREWLA